MTSPSPDQPCPYWLSHEPDGDRALDGNVLARLRFGLRAPGAADPRDVHVALPQTTTAPLAEVWRSRVPVSCGQADGCGYAHNGEVLFGQVRLEAHELADLVQATAGVYRRLEALSRRLGYPGWLRTWNFLGDINRGEGDAERYRQFNRGRHQALAHRPGFETHLPAATAIGTLDDTLTVYFLAARAPGQQVENPRQVSAFRYPPVYGPSSPSFSRACLKHWSDGSHLFVSGTASVVGHESRHPGDLLAQADETCRNVQTLLDQAGAGPFQAASVKVYVRPGQDAAAVAAYVRTVFGAHTPLVCLSGHVCRRDLLLEVEGLFIAPAHVSSQAPG